MFFQGNLMQNQKTSSTCSTVLLWVFNFCIWQAEEKKIPHCVLQNLQTRKSIQMGSEVENIFYSQNYFYFQTFIFLYIIFLVTMNGKTPVITPIEENQLQEETNQKKTFVQDIFNINYVNTSKIYYQPTSHSSDVKVNNYLCYQEGQNLYKVTEIIYQDKLIRIQDKFEVNLDPEKMKSTPNITCTKREKTCPKNIEKVRIFSKDARKNGKIEKKDKKNIVKNIVKIFISWLQKKQADKHNQIWEQALIQLKRALEQENFNNRLIKNIVGNQKTNKAFLIFLTDDAEDQIKYSRIQDKQSHYEAIELYVGLLSEGKGSAAGGSRMGLGSEDFSGSYSGEYGLSQEGGSLVDGSRQQSKSQNNHMAQNQPRRHMETRNSSNHSQNNSHFSSHVNHTSHINVSTLPSNLISSNHNHNHQNHCSSNHSSNNSNNDSNNNSSQNLNAGGSKNSYETHAHGNGSSGDNGSNSEGLGLTKKQMSEKIKDEGYFEEAK